MSAINELLRSHQSKMDNESFNKLYECFRGRIREIVVKQIDVDLLRRTQITEIVDA